MVIDLVWRVEIGERQWYDEVVLWQKEKIDT
jgi:hypothetical protein